MTTNTTEYKLPFTFAEWKAGNPTVRILLLKRMNLDKWELTIAAIALIEDACLAIHNTDLGDEDEDPLGNHVHRLAAPIWSPAADYMRYVLALGLAGPDVDPIESVRADAALLQGIEVIKAIEFPLAFGAVDGVSGRGRPANLNAHWAVQALLRGAMDEAFSDAKLYQVMVCCARAVFICQQRWPINGGTFEGLEWPSAHSDAEQITVDEISSRQLRVLELLTFIAQPRRHRLRLAIKAVEDHYSFKVRIPTIAGIRQAAHWHDLDAMQVACDVIAEKGVKAFKEAFELIPPIHPKDPAGELPITT